MTATTLEQVKGLGPKRRQSLAEQGIQSAADLLRYYPSSYIDASSPVAIADLRAGEAACVAGFLLRAPSTHYRGGMAISRSAMKDDKGDSLSIIWFNQPWVSQQWAAGDEVLIYGSVARYQSSLVMQNPRRLQAQGITPLYRALPGLPGATIRSFIEQLLPQADRLLPDPLKDMAEGMGLLPLADAVRHLHAPRDSVGLKRARHRISFDELLFYQLAMRLIRDKQEAALPVVRDPADEEAFLSRLPYQLTGAQARCLSDILTDMSKPQAMRRLVQGDVGSGKTVIALAAAYRMARAGRQTALMVPTEILAHQHLKAAQELLAPLGISCGLLLGGMKADDRRQALSAIASGDWQLVIGTHALLNDSVQFQHLGLVVTDEQHRFGVRQRKTLTDKGREEDAPHTLVMSATPIPRTLALVLYGDLEVSVLDEMPPGRQPVMTRLVPEGKRAGMYHFLLERAALGERCYIIYPLVSAEDKDESAGAIEAFDSLRRGPLKALKLGLVHGQMTGAEKERTLSAFASGAIQVLVATTVVEVGINVPEATSMVIEDAWRFGLSTLHQLRGRVGRGDRQSYCFLMGDTNERLDALVAENDGFAIAQKDLTLRGPGEFLGTRQHGAGFLSGMAGIDMRLIEDTRQAGQALLEGRWGSATKTSAVSEAMHRYALAARHVAMN